MDRRYVLLALVALSAVGACNSEKTRAQAAGAVEATESVVAAEVPEGDKPAERAAAPTPTPKKDPFAQHRVVFDLVANRHLAHVWDDGLVLDLGHASALKYAQGRWNTTWYGPGKNGATFYGHPRGVSGTLRFPIVAPAEVDPKSWKLSIRLQPVGSQRCDLFLSKADGEEKKFASLNDIASEWKTYTVDLPDDLEPGQEYTLRLHFSRSRDISGGRRSAAAIDWLRIGPGEGADVVRPSGVFDVGSETVRLREGQAVTWYTMPAQAAKFVGQVRGKVRLSATSDEAKSVVGEASDDRLVVDLASFATRPMRMTLTALSDATIVRPRLLVEAQTPRPRETSPKYLLVWLIDTLRADHLAAYNPKTDVRTPHLDAFAREAAVFTRAAVQGNSSLPTSASIFTSAYTVVHGLVREKGNLSPKHTIFGEPFDQAGWTTGLFSGNGYVSKSWGFARGFDTEVNPIRESRPSDAEYLWPEAQAWLAEQKAPVLLYINTNDPHVPYDPPAADLKPYHSGGRVGRVSPRATGELLDQMARGALELNRAEADYMRALYKGEITYNDAWFGKMLAALDELGIRDETMIVVTSDHGEEFGEYGRFGHGVSVNEELVGVPFIVGYRPWTREGRRIEQAVEVLDLFPTLLDAAGIARPDAVNIQGKSLVDLILDPTPRHPAPAYSYHNDFLRGARVGDWKYQLFNGDRDPVYRLDITRTGGHDKDDVAHEHPVARRMFRDLMAFQVGLDTAWKKSKHGYTNNHSAEAAKWLDERGW